MATESLLESALTGDSRALDELLRAWRPRARAIAFRILRDLDDAEDVAQEAMRAALAGLPRLRGTRAASYLHRVAVNHALNHLRARRRRTRHESSAAEAAALLHLAPAIPERLEEEERRARVRAEIERLEPVFRECLALRDVDGISYEEIAARTGLPLGTVKSRIHRARRRLLTTSSPAGSRPRAFAGTGTGGW
jgi:RNA polymerase sigma-70 factor (ECF subfamily)